MRIAFVTSHIKKSTQWQWFSEDLQKRNIFHIHIVINDTLPFMVDDLKKLNVPCFYLPHKNIFSLIVAFFKTVRLLIKYKIDVVHTELPYGNLVGQVAALVCGIKCRVTTMENTTWPFDYGHKKQLFIDRLTFKLSKRIIALTQIAKEFIQKKYHQPEKKITVIWHAVKPDAFLEPNEEKIKQMKKVLDINPDDFIIGMVARFEKWKGHEDVIEAVNKLRYKYPQIKLLIFGNKGESYNSVMNLVRELDLEKIVLYKNFVSDNITLFKVFDIHVHVPVNELIETAGINVMEGMMAGCAQILTKSGTAYYTVENNKNCLVVDYRSSDQIAAAIEKMIENPDLRKQLSMQARADALLNFDQRKKTESHLKLYEELLKS